jgi:hypothetical protein
MAKRWQRHEDDLLRDSYGRGTPVATIGRWLHRSEDAVVARRRALGLPPRRSPRIWSRAEDAMLRAASDAGLPAAVLAARLDRPLAQVRARRRTLGLGRPGGRAYTAAEDAFLRNAWSAGADIGALTRQLNRSPEALRIHVRRLGLHRATPRPRWRPDEDAVVREGYTSGLTCGQIAALLVLRTPTAVAARAQKLGLATFARRWTPDEDVRLSRILAIGSLEDAAETLVRTPEAVRRRARKLGLVPNQIIARPRSGRRWTSEEDERLRLHAALNPAVLAALLGRSDHAVAARLRYLGERGGRRGSPHHPSATRGGLTPGERALVRRELIRRGARALPLLERRLERSIAELRAAAGGEEVGRPAERRHHAASSY